jgi:hypothetical protein
VIKQIAWGAIAETWCRKTAPGFETSSFHERRNSGSAVIIGHLPLRSPGTSTTPCANDSQKRFVGSASEWPPGDESNQASRRWPPRSTSATFAQNDPHAYSYSGGLTAPTRIFSNSSRCSRRRSRCSPQLTVNAGRQRHRDREYRGDRLRDIGRKWLNALMIISRTNLPQMTD